MYGKRVSGPLELGNMDSFHEKPIFPNSTGLWTMGLGFRASGL